METDTPTLGAELIDLEEAQAVLTALAGSFFQSPLADYPPGSAGQRASSDETEKSDTELRYKMLLEQMPAVVFIGYMDKGLGEAYVNPHIEAMLGFTHREWLEEPVRWYRQIHADDKLRWSIDAARFFLTGEPLQAVYRVMSEDGRVVWFQCQAKMVRRADGRPFLVHGVGFDVTQLKETEESLSKALAAAHSDNKAKSDFLANMSHEVRTPINGIMGMTALALETPLTGEQRDYLEIVQSSANALLDLVNDILDISKIEDRKLKIEIAEFDPRRCIEETARLLSPLASRKGLQLFCHLLPNIPDVVRGDATRFRQILTNLIENAIKFTPGGEVVVRAQVGERTGDNIVVHCQVSDTGIGIPRDKQKLIFDRFSQVDGSARRRYGGAGLGLTICATMAEMMGGRAWVESEPGAGSTFHFTVRFEHLATSPFGPDVSRLRGMPILVVEESATGRKILSAMLTDLGCCPTCTASPEAAQEILMSDRDTGESPAVILSHSAMPGIEREDLTPLAQLSPLTRHYAGQDERKLTVVTPGKGGSAIERWKGSRIRGYLAIPIWRAELIEALLDHVCVTATLVSSPAAIVQDHSRTNLRSLRILVAEDNLVNQKVASLILRKRGHQVKIANNGLEAFRQATSERFDLILMDLQMPEMDGIEATHAIREYEAPSGVYTPIVALTAHAMEGDRERCLEAGMLGHLSKPIIQDKLFQTIWEVCGPAGKTA